MSNGIWQIVPASCQLHLPPQYRGVTHPVRTVTVGTVEFEEARQPHAPSITFLILDCVFGSNRLIPKLKNQKSKINNQK